MTPVVTQIKAMNDVFERKIKMSRKNHKMVEGRLLQMDKKFSALKEKQKTKIAEWFYEAYRKCYLESGKIPGKRDNEKILEYVFCRINEAEIWIPNREIYAYYNSRKRKLQKRLEKEFEEKLLETEMEKQEDKECT